MFNGVAAFEGQHALLFDVMPRANASNVVSRCDLEGRDDAACRSPVVDLVGLGEVRWMHRLHGRQIDQVREQPRVV